MENLLQKKFEPRRTVVLSFGFDEESGGYQVGITFFTQTIYKLTFSVLQGAKHIAGYLIENYGRHAFALLLDEGGMY